MFRMSCDRINYISQIEFRIKNYLIRTGLLFFDSKFLFKCMMACNHIFNS